MNPNRFVERLAAISLPDVFNPYSDLCAIFDLPDAPAQRRRNLQAQLEAVLEEGVDAIWVARDLGYRGGRRTGIALTDEVNLAQLSARCPGGGSISKATRGPAVAERTAAVVWRSLIRMNASIFTWNVFPLHPHHHDRPLTNRCHTRAERNALLPILINLLDMLSPKHVVAIGNDAEAGLYDLGIECTKVRHPSYGGVADFEAGMAAIHGHGNSTSFGAIPATLF